MHRNVARAYNALWAQHKPVRVAWMKILAQGDRVLERKLLRADLEDRPATLGAHFSNALTKPLPASPFASRNEPSVS